MKKSISKIILVVVCIVFVASVAMLGFKPMNITGIMKGGIKRGLDLVGGTSIVYGIKDDESGNAVNYSDADIEEVISMLRDRIDRRGYTEAVVARYGDNMILVEIPDIDDPEAAIQAIGSTAKLSFVDSNGKEVEKWVSTNEPKYIENLPEGKYTLCETQAPDGYVLATECIKLYNYE